MLRKYCLFCYAPLGEDERLCHQCGKPFLDYDFRRHWSREPKLVLMVKAFKFLILLFCFFLGYLLFGSFSHMGTGAGYFILSPLIFYVPLSLTVSCLTRRVRYIKPSTFWGIFFSLSSFAVLFCAEKGSQHFYLSLVLLVTALFIFYRVPKIFRQWQSSRIISAQQSLEVN